MTRVEGKGDGEGGKAAMATATRVAGGKEDEGVKECNKLFYS